MLKIKNPSPRKLQEILKKNPLYDSRILHYTGSIWGVGARLSAKDSIRQINGYKKRDKAGMIVLVPDINWFARHEIAVPDSVLALMQQYYPGNLTIIFELADAAFEHIAVDGKVAFRVPSDPLLRHFIDLLGEPMVSTSINYSNLPPENDLGRIEKYYDSWYNVALIPPKKVYEGSPQISTIVEYIKDAETGLESLKAIREGSVPFYEVNESFQRPLVLFVCTANICRSPIAEKLFTKMIREEGIKVRSDSAGLLEGGHMISLSSMQLLMEAGISGAQEHVSKMISPQMVSASWLVLTMEERQRDFLREAEPDMAHKIMTLNEITGYDGDIEDPYGSEKKFYRDTYNIIEDRLNILMRKIKNNDIKPN